MGAAKSLAYWFQYSTLGPRAERGKSKKAKVPRVGKARGALLSVRIFPFGNAPVKDFGDMQRLSKRGIARTCT